MKPELSVIGGLMNLTAMKKGRRPRAEKQGKPGKDYWQLNAPLEWGAAIAYIADHSSEKVPDILAEIFEHGRDIIQRKLDAISPPAKPKLPQAKD